MMTSLNLTRSTCGNRLVEKSPMQAGYPQSLMLRMMLNASRSMARSDFPRLDPQAMSENMRRDLGFIDWNRRDAE
jgi:hypothetical protein